MKIETTTYTNEAGWTKGRGTPAPERATLVLYFGAPASIAAGALSVLATTYPEATLVGCTSGGTVGEGARGRRAKTPWARSRRHPNLGRSFAIWPTSESARCRCASPTRQDATRVRSKSAVSRRDLPLGRISHQVRGASGTLGLRSIETACDTLERACKAGLDEAFVLARGVGARLRETADYLVSDAFREAKSAAESTIGLEATGT